MLVDIEGLDKADVLCALYNNSKLQGLGFLQQKPGGMSREEAEELLKEQTYFDYLFGKVMKVDLSSDTDFESGLYDRDNGSGAAQRAIEYLHHLRKANS